MADDGMRHELVDGEVTTMPPAGFEHGRVEALVAHRLMTFVGDGRLGVVVTGDTGFILARNPDTVLGPDVAFVRTDRLPPTEMRARFAEMAPDLAVEVVSPSDRASEVAEKVTRWIGAGVRLVWLVYPARRQVEVHRAGGMTRVLEGDDTLDGGDILPGFAVPVADLFAVT